MGEREITATEPARSAWRGRIGRPLVLVGLIAGVLTALFGGYELLERLVLVHALDMQTLHSLHLLRGLVASVAVAGLVAWYLLRGEMAAGFLGERAERAEPRSTRELTVELIDREERSRQYALWFVQMRWIAVSISLTLVVITVPVTGFLPVATLPWLLGWIAALAAANVWFGRWARAGDRPERQIMVQALVDLVALTGLLNASGGIENPLYVAYLFHVIIAAILLPRRKAIWVTATACVLFLALAVGEYTGLFPHFTNVLFPHGSEGTVGSDLHIHEDGSLHDHGEAEAATGHASHDPLFVAGRTLPFLGVLALTAYLTILVASRLHRSEQELARSAERALLERRRLETVVHASGLGMVLYDPDLEVRWRNPRAGEWLAFAEAAETGTSDGPVPVRRVLIERTFATGRPAEAEQEATTARGEVRHFRHAFSPVRDERSDVIQVVELIQDVTTRKALEAEALHAGKLSALGQMAAGVAHEIGNPLSSLKTRLHLLERRREPEFIDESLRLLHGQLDRIGRIVRGVSEFARNRGEEWTAWDLDDLLDEALDVVRLDRQAKNVRIDRRRAEPPVRVRGVRDQILQVFLNLLLNAVQALRDGGRVIVETAQRDGMVAVAISDDGPGMDEAVRRRLFEPFFSTRERGTGLGLSISYTLVHAHGGRIDVASRPGRGSRFTVSLPALGASARERP